MKKSVRHIKTALTALVLSSMLLTPVLSATQLSADNYINSCSCCCSTTAETDSATDMSCELGFTDIQKKIKNAPCCCSMEQDTKSSLPVPIDANIHQEKENSQEFSDVELSFSTVIAPIEKRIDNNVTYDGSHNRPLYIINSSFLI